jgi:hypothetical protein
MGSSIRVTAPDGWSLDGYRAEPKGAGWRVDGLKNPLRLGPLYRGHGGSEGRELR